MHKNDGWVFQDASVWQHLAGKTLLSRSHLDPEVLQSRSVHFLFWTGMPRFGSVRLRFGDGTVQAVPVVGSGGSSAKRAFCVSVQFNRKGRFRFRFRFLENGSGGSGSAFGFGKTVPMVLVSGSSLVPEPPCLNCLQISQRILPPRESFKVIFNLTGYFYFAGLFLETLQNIL